MVATATKKSKCLGCGKTRGHVPGCKFIPCKLCNVPDHLGHDGHCPNNPDGGAPAEETRSTRTTVDGQEAHVHHHAPHDDDEDDGDPGFVEFPPIEILEGALDALQESVNSGDFSGAKQKQDQCEFETSVDGAPLQCPNIAVMKKVVKGHCDACDRDKKSVLLRLCLPHSINVWGGNTPARLQTKMDFGAQS